VLEGPFGRGIGLYTERLSQSYELVETQGPYQLFRRKSTK
jgi:hypothetical protein